MQHSICLNSKTLLFAILHTRQNIELLKKPTIHYSTVNLILSFGTAIALSICMDVVFKIPTKDQTRFILHAELSKEAKSVRQRFDDEDRFILVDAKLLNFSWLKFQLVVDGRPRLEE